MKPSTHSGGRSAGCLSVAGCLVSATVPDHTTRAPFAAAGPTTFDMTKGGGTSRTTCRFPLLKTWLSSWFAGPFSDRNVGSAGAAALQSGVQLLASLGTRGLKERPNPRSSLKWTRRVREEHKARQKPKDSQI